MACVNVLKNNEDKIKKLYFWPKSPLTIKATNYFTIKEVKTIFKKNK